MNDFNSLFNDYINQFNSFVDEIMSSSRFNDRMSTGFDTILEAMNYSLKNGGKRIRPVLCMEFSRICGGKSEDALYFALAIEMIHTYSLIHDDLPCMDNDDIRRGKPSNHIKYGYANALLAGDGLLTLAFEILTCSHLSPDKICKAVYELSKASGPSGMIAGQVMDLENENKTVSLNDIKETDALKTGEMIKVSCILGCIAAGADAEKIRIAEKYAEKIGLSFQITDDILDVTGDTEILGKPVGSDKENNKNTYVSLLGLDEAIKYADTLTSEAIDSLEYFGNDADFLKKLAITLNNRKN